MTPNANLPAFPVTDQACFNGLSRRELFAAMAMQGLLSDKGNESSCKAIAGIAIEAADALLAELAKPIAPPKEHARDPHPCDHNWTGPDGKTLTECSKCGSGLPF